MEHCGACGGFSRNFFRLIFPWGLSYITLHTLHKSLGINITLEKTS